jgi:hypothetical protein
LNAKSGSVEVGEDGGPVRTRAPHVQSLSGAFLPH